jgi:hypothetical protein
MRFEHRAAWIMGIVLPLLEVMRRKTDFSSVTGYVDDFFAGAFLLFAAWSASRGTRYAQALLVAAWATLAGGLFGSFFGQIESALHGGTDVSGSSQAVVITIKGILYAITLYATVAAIRRDATP